MDWPAPVLAAIIAGIVSLVVGFTTAIVTIRVADRQGLVNEKIAQLKSDIDERIASQKLSIEQQQANRRTFLQKQLELCFEATDAAARLATEIKLDDLEKSRLTFWRLYWGILSIVEDQAVEGAMYKLGKIVPKKPIDSSQPLPLEALQISAYELAHAARDLMRKSWDVDLPVLTKGQTP